MAGQVKKIIDTIIQKRCSGNPALINTTKAKFMLKGINPDKYSAVSPDEPDIIEKLKNLAKELGISI